MIAGRALARAVAFAIIVAGVSSCGPSQPKTFDNRQWTDNFAFRITSDPSPPRAMEDVVYKIVVQDKKTGEPIETGEGRIFANSKDGARTNDGFAKGKEVGTYYGHLFFPTTGDWAIAVQFRRDPTKGLEKTLDWVQSVNNPSAQK